MIIKEILQCIDKIDVVIKLGIDFDKEFVMFCNDL